MRRWWKIARQAGAAWLGDNAFAHSAAVSFYTLFSLAPITLIAVSLVGLVFGEDVARRQLLAQITQLIGKQSAEMVRNALTAAHLDHGSTFSTVAGAVLLGVGATTVFVQLQRSMNEIWGVTAKPSRNTWLLLLLKRLISFAMVLTVGFLLLTSLILTTALSAAIDLLRGWMSVPGWALRGADVATGIVIITILFALLFKLMPDVRIGWRETWLGALTTAALFTIGRYGIALYLSHATLASSYGAAGSLVALLLWIYYSCAIFFYGVEFVRAHASAHGVAVMPKSTAVRVRREILRD
jgi:membrane protein